MATYLDAINAAHRSLNDASRTRYPDVDTFLYARDAEREIYVLRPDLFVDIEGVPCADGVAPQGQVEIDATSIGAEYVLDVLGVVGGRAVTKADLHTLQRYRPNWRTDPVGPCQHWFPLPTDAQKRPQPVFWIYPPAPAGQSLTVQFVRTLPNPLAVTAVMSLPDHLMPAVESYIIYRCEMVDDEHVVQQRAQAAYTNFATIIGIDDQTAKKIAIEGRPQ